LTKQYRAMLATEGVEIEFTDDAIAEIARIAEQVNRSTHNIGARRLHTVMERLLDVLLFSAPEVGAQAITITDHYVREQLAELAGDEELARYIL
jgi:ATP-dependent HslUV protease ATP-binding subunit HslU